MRKVLIIGVDGCRGDTLMKMIGNGECPNIKSICKTYASCSEYSTCGRTHSGPITGKGFMYKTAAGWATIFTGVDNYYHRVKDNEANSVKSFWKISQDKYPTIFDITRDNNKTVGVYAKPFILGTQDIPGILDKTDIPTKVTMTWDNPNGDQQLVDTWVKSEKPDLSFIHLDTTDHAGHEYGFGDSQEYKEAIRKVDRMIGDLLKSIQSESNWLVLLTSDHGGTMNKEHGVSVGYDDQIPFIISRRTKDFKIPHQIDVAPTVLKWLRLNCMDYHTPGFDCI